MAGMRMNCMRRDELNQKAYACLTRGGIAAVEMRGERNGECDYIRNV